MRFWVAGTPAPQGSKRHVGGGRMVEMSRAVGPWREAVRAEAQRLAGPVEFQTEPLSVTVVFIFRRPASHYRTGASTRHLLTASAPPFPAARKRNDIDKLSRSTLDGLADGGLIGDDGLVVDLHAKKTYAQNGESPGAVIEVEAMP